MGPLDGTRIVEISEGLAGCAAGMLFSDYGAEVIKIVPPSEEDTGRLTPGYVVWNRGKKSLTLDLESPQGREILLSILGSSDVVLETLQPGETKRLAIDYETIHSEIPGLIYCSLSGYDANGPDSERPSYDGLVQARAGFMTNSWGAGGAEHREGPKRMGFPAPSYGAAFYACFGILTALYVRNQTGLGQHVNTSLYGAAVSMTRWGWAENRGAPGTPGRGLFGMWQCGDGGYVWTHTGARGAFDRYMKVLGLDQYMASAPEPIPWSTAMSQELRTKVAELLMTKPRVEWISLFNEADLPNHAVLHPGDAFDDEQVHAVDMVATVDDPVLGKLEQTNAPIKFEKTPGSVKQAAPIKGEHTDEILLGIGMSQSVIDGLRVQGVI